MVYSKFIIEGENLIMAKCTFHKQLVVDEEQVRGGGWFKFDDSKEAFIFGGSSHDFGQAKIEDIKNCIENGNVYANSRLSRKMNNYKFFYDNQNELIRLN